MPENRRILTYNNIKNMMFKKNTQTVKSPDLSKLKEVIIDHRTKIYISPTDDVEEAKSRYFSRIAGRK
jgi:hypothetical protein